MSFFTKNAFRLFFFFSPVLSPFSSGGGGRKPLGRKKVRAEVQGRRYLGEELPFHFLHFLSSFAFHGRSPFFRYLVATSQGRSPHPSSPPSPRPHLRRAIQVNHIVLLFSSLSSSHHMPIIFPLVIFPLNKDRKVLTTPPPGDRTHPIRYIAL